VFGWGETVEGGILGSRLIIGLTVVLSALSGVWVW
jgi:succinate dehydrogenase / fumarate reductase cytochrome b subunit